MSIPQPPRSLPMAKRPFETKDLYELKSMSHPHISPDGTKVAFVQTSIVKDEDEYLSTIWVVSVDGREPFRLSSGPGDGGPRWAPDSRRISFVRRDEESKPQVFTIAVDGGEASPLT